MKELDNCQEVLELATILVDSTQELGSIQLDPEVLVDNYRVA